MASYRCSRVPAPPEAITGKDTASAIAWVIGISYPACVPSVSILVGRIAPAPRSWTLFAHSTASIAVPIVPPVTITSKPEGIWELVDVSIATVILSLPNSFEASLTKSGFRTAAVFIDTFDTPISNSSSIAWQLLIPPPTVKGINFIKLKDVGDPAENGVVYSQEGADELVFLDITATLEKRKTLLDAVKRTAESIPSTVPLTVGGGISSCEQIEELMDIGASKVSINTAAVRNPDFVKEAADKFGSEKITIAIDTSSNSQLPSGFEVMVSSGTIGTGIDAVQWAKKVEDLGAGAILPTSMDADGTEAGYDIPMTRAIADAVALPVIASGGAGTLEHLYQAIIEAHADAVLVASIAHFGKYTIRQMKEYLAERQIPVNL